MTEIMITSYMIASSQEFVSKTTEKLRIFTLGFIADKLIDVLGWSMGVWPRNISLIENLNAHKCEYLT